MKVIASLIAVAACIAVIAYTQSSGSQTTLVQSKTDVEMSFMRWIAKFEKSYATRTEYEERLEIFEDNYNWVQNHDPSLGFEVELNFLADQSDAERVEKYMGKLQLDQEDNATLPIYYCGRGKWDKGFWDPTEFEGDLPENYDFKFDTPVQNQGACGSCWAFSTVGSLEGVVNHHLKKNGANDDALVKFSEQSMLDCDTRQGGCQGGLMQYAVDYAIAKGEARQDGYDKYDGRRHSCKTFDDYFKEKDVKFKLDKCLDIKADSQTFDGRQNGEKGSTDNLMKALYQYGPQIVAVNAGNRDFGNYRSGIAKTTASVSRNRLDHGVVLVGYGTENGTPYWKIKNSWGDRWGENGYIRIERTEGYGYFGVNMEPTFASIK